MMESSSNLSSAFKGHSSPSCGEQPRVDSEQQLQHSQVMAMLLTTIERQWQLLFLQDDVVEAKIHPEKEPKTPTLLLTSLINTPPQPRTANLSLGTDDDEEESAYSTLELELELDTAKVCDYYCYYYSCDSSKDEEEEELSVITDPFGDAPESFAWDPSSVGCCEEERTMEQEATVPLASEAHLKVIRNQRYSSCLSMLAPLESIVRPVRAQSIHVGSWMPHENGEL